MKDFFLKKVEDKPDYYALNEMTELLQKAAWRLVRAAEDKFGEKTDGAEKMKWCTGRMEMLHPVSGRDAAYYEDFVRAAFLNMKIELSIMERRIV